VQAILQTAREHPKLLPKAPFFMPIGRIDEVSANRAPVLNEKLVSLPEIPEAPVDQSLLQKLPVPELAARLSAQAHTV
jgi:hypothetical protein